MCMLVYTLTYNMQHKDMRIPKSGASYSVNDGRYEDWPAGLQKYIDTVSMRCLYVSSQIH